MTQAPHREIGQLVATGRSEEALERALDQVQADALSWRAHDTVARVLTSLEENAAAVHAFRTAATLRRRQAQTSEPVTVPVHYLIHNIQQLDYLDGNGALPQDLATHMAAGQRSDLLAQLDGMMTDATPADPPFVSVSGADAHALLALPLLTPDEPVLPHLLNAAAGFTAAAAAYHARESGYGVVDDLLTADALEALRRFCLGATVWGRPYKHGYVGAFPEDGFVSMLLFRIAAELRAAMPDVLGGHKLAQWWAFSYDHRLPGTDIHGDDSDVSVNLWITPTEANLEPARGGLVMWDRASPADWTFNDYNSGGGKVRSWLEEQHATAAVVPHRENRALVFRGRTFHSSDGTRFVPGYQTRRRNITFLFRRAS